MLDCSSDITIGSDCLFSWDVMLMDSDYHPIFDAQSHEINKPKPIQIGNHVWIGCGTKVLKGSRVSDNTVIAAGSLLSGSFDERNVILAGRGNEVRIVKDNITWKK